MNEPALRQVVRDGRAEKIERKSRFLGFVFRAVDDETVARRRAQLASEHPRATHHVYAWRRYDPLTRRVTHDFDDAGEPGGTAGRPVLAVLEANRVVNALCVVIRYFGGIKLGAGGLVRAYSQTASLAIHDSGLEPLEAKMRLRVAVEFALLAPVETFLARESVDVIARSFTPDPVFRIALAESRREAFVRRLMNLTAGRAVIRPDDG